MSIWGVYKRALSMLAAERAQTFSVVMSGIALGAVPIAEGVLLKHVVDALTLGQGAFPIIGVWAVVGLVGILAGVVVAVMADRLAHRRRLAALGQAFERAIVLPISYHAEKGSGAVVRTILAGTDALFWNWLSFLREQFVALVGILVLIPTAIYMNLAMALILAVLAVVYVLCNVLVAQKTSTGQAAVEQYHHNVYGRVGDVLGNVTVVQSYGRFASEMQAMRSIMAELLTAQAPPRPSRS
jgi:ATP-binding cassette subfamily B protein